MENENSKNLSKWGGSRVGAGRPKGTENEETRLRRLMEAEMRSRIVRSTDALLNSQMSLAQGEVNLYRVYYEGEGKNRKKIVDVVNDQETITLYLADELEISNDEEYYYIATKSPDSRSIDSLLDRTYGKAKQSLDVTSDGERIGLSAEQAEQLIRARANRSNT
jgi:hypothetical protein